VKLTDDEITAVRILIAERAVKSRLIRARLIRAEMKESDRKDRETEMIRDIHLAIGDALDNVSVSNERLDKAARAVFRIIGTQHG
jgi:hypothetical protein